MLRMQSNSDSQEMLIGMKMTQALWKQFSRSLKMRFTSPDNSYILFLGIYPGSHKNIYSDKDFYMNIHSTLFITVKLETNIHQQVNEKIIWYTHTMEYYLAIKRTELLTHATAWMNLETIIPRERSQRTD